MPVARMPDPAVLVPAGVAALAAAAGADGDAGLDPALLALCHLRASQINGSGRDTVDGARRYRELGATADRADAVAAWRDAPWFTGAERAALALTEAVTRLADRADPVPDTVWDAAAGYFDQKELAVLVLRVAVTNAVNRLHTPTRQQPV